MDLPSELRNPRPEPSLHSEFGPDSVNETAVLRFGAPEAFAPSDKIYSFTGDEPPRKNTPEAPAGAMKPEAILIQEAVEQTVRLQAEEGQYSRPRFDEGPAIDSGRDRASRRNAEHGRTGSGPWIAIAITAALLLGLVLGAFGHQLWMDHRKQQSAAQDTENRDSDPAMRPADIYTACSPAVVGITAVRDSDPTGAYTAPSVGSGFLIRENGYLLTNYHVVRDAAKVEVTLFDGRTLEARLVAWEDKTSDLAMLKIEASGLRTAELGNSAALRVGEQVCTVGNPFGELTYSLTVGYVSALDRTITTEGASVRVLQTDTAINSGNSGGPLFDSTGKVVAVITAKYSGNTEPDGAAIEGLGFAIPINDVKSLAERWMQNDSQP